jgi:hypothetical protein
VCPFSFAAVRITTTQRFTPAIRRFGWPSLQVCVLLRFGLVLRMTTLQNKDSVEPSVEKDLRNVKRTRSSARQAQFGRIGPRIASTKGGRRRMAEPSTPSLLYVDAPLFLLALAIGGRALAIASPVFSAAVSAYLTQ